MLSLYWNSLTAIIPRSVMRLLLIQDGKLGKTYKPSHGTITRNQRHRTYRAYGT